MWARRADTNHAITLAALRACGWYCLDLHHVPAFVDALAIRAGRVVFIEIKDGHRRPSARRLTRPQVQLHADLRAAGAEVVVLTGPEDAVRL